MNMLIRSTPVAALFIASSAHAAAGLPQLDSTWFANQLFWLVVTFTILYLIVSRFIVPSVSQVLEVRESAIHAAIAEAEEAKRAAEGTRSHYESQGMNARGRASELMAKAQAESNARTNEAFEKLDRELSQKAERAETRIEEAKSKAAGAMQKATAELAVTMVEKLLGRTVDTKDAERIITPLLAAKTGH
jgi:F-type H+-transporting ATPase subunit b